ncbi:MAG: putative Ig domain-containing protein [Phycisphaerae bacterium]
MKSHLWIIKFVFAAGAAATLGLLGPAAVAAAPSEPGQTGQEEAVFVGHGVVGYVEETIDAVLERERLNPPARGGSPLEPRHRPTYPAEKAAAAAGPYELPTPGDPGENRPGPVLVSFSNPGSCGCEPPDPILTVGPNHILAGINDDIRAFNKSTTATVWSATWESFFSSVNPAGAGSFASDPRVFFDPGSQRYFATILMVNNAQTKSWWMLAVSTSDQIGNGTTAWRKWALDPTVASPGAFADYPGFGFNADAVFISSNMFTAVERVDVAVIPKAQLLVATPTPTFTQLRNITTSTGAFALTIQPAHTFGAGDEFMASTTTGSGSQVFFYRVNTPLATPTLTKATQSVTSYSTPPNAAQRGSAVTIDTIDSRMMNVVWRNNRLWCTHPTGQSSLAAARWYEFDTTVWPTTPTTLQTGTVTAASTHYYFPSIAVDQFNNAAMGFTRSIGGAAGEYPSAWHTYRASTDGAGTMVAPVRDHAGPGAYSGTRQGRLQRHLHRPDRQHHLLYHAGVFRRWRKLGNVDHLVPGAHALRRARSSARFRRSRPPAAWRSPPALRRPAPGPRRMTWSLSGSPPGGMTINPANGVVSWSTPSLAGSPYTISLTVTNACGSDTKTFALTVNPNAPTVTPPANASVACGAAFVSSAPSTTGGVGPFTWSLGGSPPGGMTIVPATGVVSWPAAVAAAVPYTITVQANSACGNAAANFMLTVRPGDFNGDGLLTAADIGPFVSSLVGLTSSCAADVNFDGSANGDDVQVFVNGL